MVLVAELKDLLERYRSAVTARDVDLISSLSSTLKCYLLRDAPSEREATEAKRGLYAQLKQVHQDAHVIINQMRDEAKANMDQNFGVRRQEQAYLETQHSSRG